MFSSEHITCIKIFEIIQQNVNIFSHLRTWTFESCTFERLKPRFHSIEGIIKTGATKPNSKVDEVVHCS